MRIYNYTKELKRNGANTQLGVTETSKPDKVKGIFANVSQGSSNVFWMFATDYQTLTDSNQTLSNDYQTPSNKTRILTGHYQAISSDYQTLAGNNQTPSNDYQALSNGNQILADKNQALSNGYQTSANDYQALSNNYYALVVSLLLIYNRCWSYSYPGFTLAGKMVCSCFNTNQLMSFRCSATVISDKWHNNDGVISQCMFVLQYIQQAINVKLKI